MAGFLVVFRTIHSHANRESDALTLRKTEIRGAIHRAQRLGLDVEPRHLVRSTFTSYQRSLMLTWIRRGGRVAEIRPKVAPSPAFASGCSNCV